MLYPFELRARRSDVDIFAYLLRVNGREIPLALAHCLDLDGHG